MGKKMFMSLFGRIYRRITLKEVESLLDGLDLAIVGGLKSRGYTNNDIDIVGAKGDVSILAGRLAKKNIDNPLHYCGNRSRHFHSTTIYYGIKMAITGKGY